MFGIIYFLFPYRIMADTFDNLSDDSMAGTSGKENEQMFISHRSSLALESDRSRLPITNVFSENKANQQVDLNDAIGDDFDIDDIDLEAELIECCSQTLSNSINNHQSNASTNAPPPGIGAPKIEDVEMVELEEEVDEETTDDNEGKSFSEVLFHNLIARQDASGISHFLDLLIHTISEHNSILLEIHVPYKAMLLIANNALVDVHFRQFAPKLQQFFSQVIHICDKLFNWQLEYHQNDWLNTALVYAENVKKILTSTTVAQSNRTITFSLIPSALCSNFILCFFHYQLTDLVDLVKLNAELLELLPSSPSPLSENDYSRIDDLAYMVTKAVYYLQFIFANLLVAKRRNSNETLEHIGRIICSHIGYVGIDDSDGGGGGDGGRQRSVTDCFNRMMGNRIVAAIAYQLKITKHQLFLGLADEVSKCLTNLCINGHPFTMIRDCLLCLFGISNFPGEITHVMLPSLIILHNDITNNFFKYFQRISPNNRSIDRLILSEPYLCEIVSAFFFEANYSNAFLAEVIGYLSHHLKRNVLKDIQAIDIDLNKHFMLYYSDNEQASLAGLSFLYCLEAHADEANLTLDIFDTSVELDLFQRDSKLFGRILENYFLNFCSCFRGKMLAKNGNLWYRKTKGKFLKSFKLLLLRLSSGMFRKLIVPIYHVIKFLFNLQNHHLELEHQLAILSTFIDLADDGFIRCEIASICLMVMPFVKLKPEECVSIYRKLILERSHSIDVYYQLYFVSNLPNAEELTQTMQAHIAAETNFAPFRLPVDQWKVENDDSMFDHNKLILFLGTITFGQFCHEMIYPLEHLTRSDLALHPVALRKIKRMLTDIAENSEFYLILNDEATFEEAKSVTLNFGNRLEQVTTATQVMGTGSSSGQDMAMNIPRLMAAIVTVGDFFNFLVTTLFQVIKYSNPNCRSIALDCLGILGAVNAKYLGMSRPSVALAHAETPLPATKYLFHDFRCLDHFDPRKKEFKVLLLQVFASMLGNTTEDLDFNLIAFSIQKLHKEFTTSNHDVIHSLLGIPLQHDMPVRFNKSYYKNLVAEHCAAMYPSQTSKKKRAETEHSMLQLINNELDVPIDLKRDLKQEVRELVLTFKDKLDFSLSVPEPTVVSIATFFDSVRPTMTFATFVESFIDMLYGCFIYPAFYHDTDAIKTTEAMPEMPKIAYEEIFSQMPSTQAQHLNYRQDWERIYEKLNKLRVPKSIFFICSFKLTANAKLRHLLMPSMLILSLGLASQESLKEFCRRFRSMLDTMIGDNRYFLNELGPMFVELLVTLYDYLLRWQNNRKSLHDYVINTLPLKDRVERYDNEFKGVKMLLEQVPLTMMIHLTYQSKSYHRALFYLESYLEDNRRTKSQVGFEGIVRDNLDYFYRIYSSLYEQESIDAVNRFQTSQSHPTLPTLAEMFLRASAGTASTDRIVAGARLVASNLVTEHKLLKILHSGPSSANQTPEDKFNELRKTSLYSDNRQRYLETVVGLQQDLPNFCETSEARMLAREKYQLEMAMELNKWDMLDDVGAAADRVGRESLGSNYSATFGSTVAANQTFSRVLIGLYNQQPPIRLDDLINNEVKEAFVHPLTAAMLVNSETAYARAYSESIVPIHMLKDVEEFREYLRIYIDCEQSPAPSPTGKMAEITEAFNRMLKLWRIRNRLIPQGSGDRLRALATQKAMIALAQKKHQESFGGQYCLTMEYFRYLNDCVVNALAAGDLDLAYGNTLAALNLANEFQSNPGMVAAGAFENDLNQMERTDYILGMAKVLWCRSQHTEAIRLIKAEADKHQMLQQHIYTNLLEKETPETIEMISDVFELPIEVLQNPVKNCAPPATTVETRRCFAKLQLQYARYCHESRVLDVAPGSLAFHAAVEAYPDNEEAHYRLAMFYLQLSKEMQQVKPSLDTVTPLGKLMIDEQILFRTKAVCSFASSLRYDYKYAITSLPLMWQTWTSIGRELYNRRKVSSSSNMYLDCLARNLAEAKKAIDLMEQSINSAIFFVILDQIIATLAHPWEDVQRVASKLLVKLIVNYRYHMAWQFSRLRRPEAGNRFASNSTQEMQRKRRDMLVQDVMREATKISDSASVYFRSFDLLMEHLEKMTGLKLFNNGSYQAKISVRYPSVISTFEALRHKGEKIVLPCNNFFLPNLLNLQRMSDDNLFDQFYKHIFIEMIEDEALEMKSLQAPKRLTVLCSDGRRRNILTKVKDDLRKDRCMLNFCNLFNECHRGNVPPIWTMYQVDPLQAPGEEERRWSARRREPLQLQTYFTVPLLDQFGIIEWLPGLKPFKVLAEGEYQRTVADKEKFDTHKTLLIKRQASIRQSSSGQNTRQVRIAAFKQFYPKFQPPRFQNWFTNYYTDPYSWWQARKNFTRSVAVYSMLGYMLGLGDRHAENIMLDTSTGQAVHVDFNALFNVAETFMVPECVPFRLTQNMSAAMGVFGHEGMFRKTCEDVLYILRQYRELFAVQVNQLLEDPLREWKNDGYAHSERMDRVRLVTSLDSIINVLILLLLLFPLGPSRSVQCRGAIVWHGATLEGS